MFRKELPLDHGMLFVFENPLKATFWMKYMLFPIDIIFINQMKQVVKIVENVSPCVQETCELISSKTNIKYVIEINAGLSRVHSFKVGDVVSF